MARLISAEGAGSQPRPRAEQGVFDVDLAVTAQKLAEGVRAVPGVTDLFRIPTGFSRWFGEPSVQLQLQDGAVHAAVCIGVDGGRSAPQTAEAVRTHLLAALEADGFAVGGVRVQVALVGR